MNSPDLTGTLRSPIPDVQGSRDERRWPIERVGIRGIRHPILWRSAGVEQPSVARCTLDVALPAEQKGTHMSRFVALLDEQREALDVAGLVELHARMLERLHAERGVIALEFPLFVRKAAPVSGVTSLMDYELRVQVAGPVAAPAVLLQVQVPVTSLCPCSKAISDYGAHNQRSHVTIAVSSRVPVEPEDLIRLAEAQASSELYGLLKRVDEKVVTERAYDNPKFVEDLVRDVAAALAVDTRINAFRVEVENFESIHNHSAYACIESAGFDARRAW